MTGLDWNFFWLAGVENSHDASSEICIWYSEYIFMVFRGLPKLSLCGNDSMGQRINFMLHSPRANTRYYLEG